MATSKKAILGFVIAILLVVGIWFLFNIRNFSEDETADFSYRANGRIVEVKVDALVIGGIFGEYNTAELIITPETVFNNMVIVISKNQMESEGQFIPETEDRNGSFSDLSVGVQIIGIKTNEDLSIVNKATAIEIKYITYDLPERSVE